MLAFEFLGRLLPLVNENEEIMNLLKVCACLVDFLYHFRGVTCKDTNLIVFFRRIIVSTLQGVL